MAKQIGILRISGTLESINFYLRKGVPVARKAGGGFDGKKIKSSPSMVRVRENGSEFGHCSRVKKVFKDALSPYLTNYKDAGLHSKMMQLFLAIKDLDLISERGKRTVVEGLRNTEGLNLLTKFNFTEMSFPFEKNDYSFTIGSFLVDSVAMYNLKYTKENMYLEFQYGIITINFNPLHAVLYKSDLVRLSKNDIGTRIELLVHPIVTNDFIALAIVSYRYVEEVNGVFYHLNDSNSFGLKVLGLC